MSMKYQWKYTHTPFLDNYMMMMIMMMMMMIDTAVLKNYMMMMVIMIIHTQVLNNCIQCQLCILREPVCSTAQMALYTMPIMTPGTAYEFT